MRFSMMKVALLVLIAMVTSSAAAGGARKTESTAVDQVITLDGDHPEWEGIPAIYLEENVRVLTIAHNNENLYLMFRFADDRRAREIMRRGVTLWINGDGKPKNKKEEFAVRYPGSAQIADYLDSDEAYEDGQHSGGYDRGDQGTPPPELASLRQIPGQLTVIVDGMKTTVDESNTAGPSAASAVTDSRFCYEFRIPISDIGGEVSAVQAATTRKIAIGIQIGGMTKAEQELVQSVMRQRRGDLGGMAGGPGGGGVGGRSGGGMRGGGMGGRPSEGGQLEFDPEIQWLSVTLHPVNSE